MSTTMRRRTRRGSSITADGAPDSDSAATQRDVAQGHRSVRHREPPTLLSKWWSRIMAFVWQIQERPVPQRRPGAATTKGLGERLLTDLDALVPPQLLQAGHEELLRSRAFLVVALITGLTLVLITTVLESSISAVITSLLFGLAVSVFANILIFRGTSSRVTLVVPALAAEIFIATGVLAFGADGFVALPVFIVFGAPLVLVFLGNFHIASLFNSIMVGQVVFFFSLTIFLPQHQPTTNILSPSIVMGSWAANAVIITIFALLQEASYRRSRESLCTVVRQLHEVAGEVSKERQHITLPDDHKVEVMQLVSTDLRQPLIDFVGCTCRLLDVEGLSNEQRDHISMVRQCAEQLVALSRDIQHYMAIEVGASSFLQSEFFNAHDFDLHALVEELSMLAAAPLAQRGIELVCHVTRQVPDFVSGNDVALRHVIAAAMEMVTKGVDEGDKEVIVSALVEAETETDVDIFFEVTVKPAPAATARSTLASDTGVMSSEEPQLNDEAWLEHVVAFVDGRHIRVDRAVQSQAVSAGVGRIVAVSFVVPLAKQHPVARRGPSAYLAAVDGRHALCAVRSPAVAAVLEHHLRAFGMQCEYVLESGRAAEMMDGQRFDLIILDSALAGADAFVRAQRALSHSAGQQDATHVLILSSPGRRMVAGQRHLGVTKPVTGTNLESAVTQLFNPGIQFRTPTRPTTRPPGFSAKPVRSGAMPSILVAQGDDVSLRVATGVLRKLGYKAETVRNGEDALDAVRRRRRDIVFIDLELPVLDGLQAAAAIRKDEPKGEGVVIVALTAHVLPGDRQMAMRVGMDDFLPKPLTLAAMQGVLNRWMLDTHVGGGTSAAPPLGLAHSQSHVALPYMGAEAALGITGPSPGAETRATLFRSVSAPSSLKNLEGQARTLPRPAVRAQRDTHMLAGLHGHFSLDRPPVPQGKERSRRRWLANLAAFKSRAAAVVPSAFFSASRLLAWYTPAGQYSLQTARDRDNIASSIAAAASPSLGHSSILSPQLDPWSIDPLPRTPSLARFPVWRAMKDLGRGGEPGHASPPPTPMPAPDPGLRSRPIVYHPKRAVMPAIVQALLWWTLSPAFRDAAPPESVNGSLLVGGVALASGVAAVMLAWWAAASLHAVPSRLAALALAAAAGLAAVAAVVVQRVGQRRAVQTALDAESRAIDAAPATEPVRTPAAQRPALPGYLATAALVLVLGVGSVVVAGEWPVIAGSRLPLLIPPLAVSLSTPDYTSRGGAVAAVIGGGTLLGAILAATLTSSVPGGLGQVETLVQAGLMVAVLLTLGMWAHNREAARRRVLAARFRAAREARDVQRALQDVRDCARHVQKSRVMVLSHISRDARVPLNGVIGLGEYLVWDRPGTEGKGARGATLMPYVSMLRKSGERFLMNIERLLEHAAMESGVAALDDVDFDLHALVEEIVKLMSPAAARKGVSVACIVPRGVPAAARGDRLRLRSTIVGLLTNAVANAPCDGGEAVVGVSADRHHREHYHDSNAVDVVVEAWDIDFSDPRLGKTQQLIDQMCGTIALGMQKKKRRAAEATTPASPPIGPPSSTAAPVSTVFGFTLRLRLGAEEGGVAGTTNRLLRVGDDLARGVLQGKSALVLTSSGVQRAVLEAHLSMWLGVPISHVDSLSALESAVAAVLPYIVVLDLLSLDEDDAVAAVETVSAAYFAQDEGSDGPHLLLLRTPGGRNHLVPLLSLDDAMPFAVIPKPVTAARLARTLAQVCGHVSVEGGLSRIEEEDEQPEPERTAYVVPQRREGDGGMARAHTARDLSSM